MAERLQRSDLSMVGILQNPTPSALARRDQGGQDPGGSAAGDGSEDATCFCIHPATGKVLVFVSLANYFVSTPPSSGLRAASVRARNSLI